MNMQQPGSGAAGGGDGWYYALGSSRFGPVPMGRLIELIRVEQVRPDTLVWREGMGDWVAGRTVAELQASFAGAAQAGTHAAPPTAPGQIGMAGGMGAGGHMNYAGFWIRFGAVFIDGIILWVAGFIVQMILMAGLGGVAAVSSSGGGGNQNPGPAIALVLISWLATIVMQWIYYAKFESSSWQATLGKKACGLVVTDMNGERISFGRASGRYFASILSAFILCIGYIMGAFTEKKQTLHDIIVGTLVLKR